MTTHRTKAYEKQNLAVHIAAMGLLEVESELRRCREEHAGGEVRVQGSCFPLSRSAFNREPEAIQERRQNGWVCKGSNLRLRIFGVIEVVAQTDQEVQACGTK